jgi:hypothetical protein
MTWVLTVGAPSVAGGWARLSWIRPSALAALWARRWALKPKSIMPARISLMVAGSLRFRKAIAAAVPGLKRFLPCLRRKLRMA